MTAIDESEPMEVLDPATVDVVEVTATDNASFSGHQPHASDGLKQEPIQKDDVIKENSINRVQGDSDTDTESEGSAQSLEGGQKDQKASHESDKEEPNENNAESPATIDFATQRRMEQEAALQSSSKEVIEPLKMLRKGATAVVGGTVLGVGLVMIPLPTPCGCVVASSGLAILGSEFEGAKKMNDKLIDTTKTNLEKARDSMINRIQSMNSNDDCSEDETETEKEGESPTWLNNMNAAERKRQQKKMKEMYRRENQSTNEQFREYMSKKTGSFLSRTLLPVLNRSKGSTAAKPSDVASMEGEAASSTAAAAEVMSAEAVIEGTEQSKDSLLNSPSSAASDDLLESTFEMVDRNEVATTLQEKNNNVDGNAISAAL
eukprot:scaffold22713_cov139-Cylindrotheca_fusiformis.AAC.18